MRSHAFWALSLAFFHDAAIALPYGCGGVLGILNVKSENFNNLVWTCAGIDPGYKSLYWSGQNVLLAVETQANASSCANYCGGWYNDFMNAAVWYANQTCECWLFGDIDTSPLPATSSNSNATFIDFYETGNGYGPSHAQNWGDFTCPEGAYSITGYFGYYGGCWPLNVFPAQPPLAELGGLGLCDCKSYGAQWILTNNDGICNCYGDLTGLKVSYNISSPWTVVDLYDFLPHSSSTSTRTTTSHVSSSTQRSSSSRTTTSHHTSSSLHSTSHSLKLSTPSKSSTQHSSSLKTTTSHHTSSTLHSTSPSKLSTPSKSSTQHSSSSRTTTSSHTSSSLHSTSKQASSTHSSPP